MRLLAGQELVDLALELILAEFDFCDLEAGLEQHLSFESFFGDTGEKVLDALSISVIDGVAMRGESRPVGAGVFHFI